MSQEVRWSPTSQSDLKRIDQQTQQRIRAAVYRFANENHGDVQRLQGSQDEWRLRVGQFRIRYTYDQIETGRIIRILRVLPRDRAYRDSDD